MADDETGTNLFGKRALSNILIVVASVYVGFLLYQSAYFNYQLNNKVEKLESQITKQETERLGFEALISYYKTDTFQELEARRKLGMRFPGEKVVKVEIGQQLAADEDEPVDNFNNSLSTNNIKLWLDFFAGKLKKM